MIVTIDGPAGSGKSTTARAVAQRLGFVYLDTGAMYRAVALAFLRSSTEPTPEEAASLLSALRVGVSYEDGTMHVTLNGEDVTQRIRTQEVGAMASRISQMRRVRDKLVEEQRRVGHERAASEGGVVLDGRDTGTVVFPDADVKIFMTADAQERARRRQAQYAEEGHEVALDEVLREIQTRDQADRDRDIAPLRKADDAVELDTTHRSVEEQVEFVAERVKAQQAQGT